MKEWSREKLTLLILVAVVFLTGIGVMLWQNVSNNNMLTSVAANTYQGDSNTPNTDNVVNNNEANNNHVNNYNSNNGTAGDNNIPNSSHQVEDKDNKIMVHVAGEVNSPGVYQLSYDARVVDAVDASGGATSLANLDSINLASPINDGQKIYIPSVIERVNQIKNQNTTVSGSDNANSSINSSGKININTASASRLQDLSGIGPSKAESIIDYREDNGRFASVDELLKVSGIGEVTLEKIRDDIVVR
ncbi:MAG: helix-hairpin-helix domain-containing protein [Halanaerobiales bacterium]